MKNIALFSLCIIALFCSCDNKLYYYVATNGDDTNPGSIEQPFATLEKAKEAARKEKNKTITVFLNEGTYYLEKPVVFSPEDSRKKDAPLTFAALNGKKVIISGARKLPALKWEKYSKEQAANEENTRADGIIKASVPAGLIFDQIFINGELQRMARYPNYDSNIAHYNGFAADAAEPVRAINWSDPAGGYIHASHRHEWGGYHWIIKGKNDKNELDIEGGWQNNRLMGMHRERRFVENIFEELDTPGEWFYSKKENAFYFYPPQGMNIENLSIETPQIPHLFELKGSESNPVEYINFEGLELTHTLRTFMETREQLLRSDWAIYRGGAVLMEGTRYCTIKKCFFNTVGGNAVFFSNYNRNNEVSGCHIAYAGANGVCFVGDPNAVRSPSFEYNEFVPVDDLDRETGPKTNNYPAECLVYDNLMYGLGSVEKQIAGVQISMSRDITVSHNTIYDLPRSGINISEGTWGGHILEFNDVFNTVLETGDHGSFNSWGRDRYWHPNYDTLTKITMEHPELILLDAVKATIIRNNRFRCDHGWDIDLDDGSSNYHIYNNLCLNGGLKLREGFFRTVENNIMINNSFHPHVWFPNSGDIFKNNIVSTGYFPIRVNDWGKEVDFNIFPDEIALKKAQENGTDKNSVFDDGTLEYLDPKKGDFRVKEGSIALKAGFRNFDMDNFGVISPELKALAKPIPIPELIRLGGNNEEIQEVLGMKVKNITTLGERSAAGLSDESGVWIVEVLPGSPIKDALQANDVILKINSSKITDIRNLKEALINAQSAVNITYSRNQKENIVRISIR